MFVVIGLLERGIIRRVCVVALLQNLSSDSCWYFIKQSTAASIAFSPLVFFSNFFFEEAVATFL